MHPSWLPLGSTWYAKVSTHPSIASLTSNCIRPELLHERCVELTLRLIFKRIIRAPLIRNPYPISIHHARRRVSTLEKDLIALCIEELGALDGKRGDCPCHRNNRVEKGDHKESTRAHAAPGLVAIEERTVSVGKELPERMTRKAPGNRRTGNGGNGGRTWRWAVRREISPGSRAKPPPRQKGGNETPSIRQSCRDADVRPLLILGCQ